jgi:predicted GH43/DUF377 family glycosyl hydrolase
MSFRPLKLQRISNDPILRPRKDVAWEHGAVFNCAVVYDAGVYHMYYRAVVPPNRSKIGYAHSTDGINFTRRPDPLLVPETPEESVGVEDPRVTRIDDTWYMHYTAWNEREVQVGMATSPDLLNWTKRGISVPYSFAGHNKDVVLFPRRFNGRYCMLHRPEPDMYIAYSRDLFHWEDSKFVMGPLANGWEDMKVGAGAPPIETPAGWLCITHSVDAERRYRLAVVVLDLDDPSKIVYRQAEPILEPELDWELHGDVPNVVFTCGAVLRGTELLVYYGGADTVIGLASADVGDFLRRLPRQ